MAEFKVVENKVNIPIFGFGIVLNNDSIENWLYDLQETLIEKNKIDPSKYDRCEDCNNINVPMDDLFKASGIDKSIDLNILDSYCFDKCEIKNASVIFVNDSCFDETLTAIEKKNIMVDVFYKVGLFKEQGIESIGTILDIVRLEQD